MAKSGPKCTICEHPKREQIEKAAKETTGEKAALKFGLSKSTVNKHMSKCPPKVPFEASAVPEDLDPLAKAKLHCKRIDEAMRVSERAGLSTETAKLYGQYTNALRHHARLSGALDITQGQIVKSTPWVQLRALIRKTLEAHPAALKDFDEALRIYTEGA